MNSGPLLLERPMIPVSGLKSRPSDCGAGTCATSGSTLAAATCAVTASRCQFIGYVRIGLMPRHPPLASQVEARRGRNAFEAQR